MVQFRAVGFKPHGFLTMRQGFSGLIAVDKHLPKIRSSRSEVRIAFNRGAKFGQGFVEPRLGPVDKSEIIVSGSVSRVALQGGAELLGGFFPSGLIVQRQAEVVHGLGEFGSKAQGGAAAADGPIEFPQGAVCLGEIGVKDRKTRPQRNGAADEVDGTRLVAALVIQYPQKMKGGGILGIGS
jgi:hypothetical protein